MSLELHPLTLEIELPPLIEDSFELPVEDEDKSILISPSIVDKKIKHFLNLKNASPSVTPNVRVLIPSSDEVELISAEQLRDIVFAQIIKNSDVDLSVDEVVSRGMKIAQSVYKQSSNALTERTTECGFEDIMYEMLKRSWVSDSTAKSLTGYVSKFLVEKEDKDAVKWDTVKEIFGYSVDDKTLILIFLVTYSYVLAISSPEKSLYESYPGYYLKDLQKYITSGVIMATELLQTNVDWPAVIVRSSGQSMINGLALSEWFVLSVLGLQTGYVGFRLGEKVWNLVHTVVNKCQSTAGKNKPISKKQIKRLIEQQSRLLLGEQ